MVKSLTFFPQQENKNFWKAFSKNSFLKQVTKILSNLTKLLCTSWKLGASYIVINRKLFKFFAVPKMKLLVEFSIVQPSIRMARLATFLKVGLVWRKFTFAILTLKSLGFLAKLVETSCMEPFLMVCNKGLEIIIWHQIFLLYQVEKKTSE